MSVKKSILVLEDEMPLSELIKSKLEKEGYDVTTARSVEQAKQYIHDNIRIDLIWVDHYLVGNENGLDFAMWCKDESNEKCKIIPIFIVSNNANSDRIFKYMNLNTDKYFVKANYHLDEIISEINKILIIEK